MSTLLNTIIFENKYNTGGVHKKKREKYCRDYSSTERQEALAKMEVAANNFLLILPFFGFLLTRQKLVDASKWVPTAGVDGRNFYYNVGFINDLSIQEIQFLLCHELLHLIYGHLLRANYPNGLPRIHSLYNIAADYNVNADSLAALTLNSREPDLPDGCYYERSYANYATEEIYEILLKKIMDQIKKQKEEEKKKEKSKEQSQDDSSGQGQGQGQGDGQGQGEGQGQSGEQDDSDEISKEEIEKAIEDMFPNGSFDDHFDLSGETEETGGNESSVEENSDGQYVSTGAPDLSQSSVDRNMENFKGDLIIAKDTMGDVEGGTNAGRLPAGVLRVLKELEEPVFDWRKYVKKHVLGLKKQQLSWTTPKRRGFDSNFILPGKKPEKIYKIHICLDTSGSIREEELRDFLSEVYGAARQLRNVEIMLWTFDTEIYNVQTFTKRDIHKIVEYKIYGNGGTDFMKNFLFMKEENIRPDLFVMFTDGGYFGEPGIKGFCDTLYVIHDDHARHVNIDPAYGRTIHYKRDSKTKRKA